MPNPIFTKAGHPLGDFTFSRPYVLPVIETHTPNQILSYGLGASAGGTRPLKIYDLGGIERVWTLVFRSMPYSEVVSVRNWIEDSAINYALRPFTFIDVASATHTVRYLDQSFVLAQTSYLVVDELRITLRIGV